MECSNSVKVEKNTSRGDNSYIVRIQKQGEEAQEIVRTGVDVDEALVAAVVARNEYYRQLDTYTGSTSGLAGAKKLTKASQGLWKKVAKAIEKASLTSEDYIRIQFSFYHRVFGKAPEPHFLHTEAAVIRAIDAKVPTFAIVGSLKDKLSDNDYLQLMKYGERMIQSLIVEHGMTREELYIALVIPGLVELPRVFLESDQAYKRALERSKQ